MNDIIERLKRELELAREGRQPLFDSLFGRRGRGGAAAAARGDRPADEPPEPWDVVRALPSGEARCVVRRAHAADAVDVALDESGATAAYFRSVDIPWRRVAATLRRGYSADETRRRRGCDMNIYSVERKASGLALLRPSRRCHQHANAAKIIEHGRRLVEPCRRRSCATDGSVVVWDRLDGLGATPPRPAHRLEAKKRDGCLCCDASRGVVIAATTARTVALWDASSGRAKCEVNNAHGGSAKIYGARLFDGATAFATCATDRLLKLWDVRRAGATPRAAPVGSRRAPSGGTESRADITTRPRPRRRRDAAATPPRHSPLPQVPH